MYALVILFVSLNGAPPAVSEATLFPSESLCWSFESKKLPLESGRHPGYKLIGYCVPADKVFNFNDQ